MHGPPCFATDNSSVKTIEIVIWSALFGALLLLVLGALADALRARVLSAWRGLAFVLLTSTEVLLLTGLPEYLVQITDPHFLLPLKIAFGPLTGALSLIYLGVWLGMNFEDRLIKTLLVWGAQGSFWSGIGILSY
jgi:hypothetical protein